MNKIFLILCSSIAFIGSVVAQDAEETKKPKGIQIRALAFSLSNNIEKLNLRAGERDLGEVFLETNRLGERYGVPIRQFSFGVNQADGKFLPMGQVILPEAGRDFILVFVPIKTGYRVFPIRADDPDFGSDHSILFNFTPHTVGAVLGGSAKKISSMKYEKLKPEIKEGDTYYQATFACEENGKMVPFNNTRWPVNPNLKALVFVYLDPNTHKPVYRAVSTLASENIE